MQMEGDEMTSVKWSILSLILFCPPAWISAQQSLSLRSWRDADNSQAPIALRFIKKFGPGYIARFSADGKLFALLDSDYIEVMESGSWRRLYILQPEKLSGFNNVAFSPDSKYLATRHVILKQKEPFSLGEAITLWDA